MRSGTHERILHLTGVRYFIATNDSPGAPEPDTLATRITFRPGICPARHPTPEVPCPSTSSSARFPAPESSLPINSKPSPRPPAESCANSVRNPVGPQLRTGDKIYCIYIAPMRTGREHARQGGFPANSVAEVTSDHRSHHRRRLRLRPSTENSRAEIRPTNLQFDGNKASVPCRSDSSNYTLSTFGDSQSAEVNLNSR